MLLHTMNRLHSKALLGVLRLLLHIALAIRGVLEQLLPCQPSVLCIGSCTCLQCLQMLHHIPSAATTSHPWSPAVAASLQSIAASLHTHICSAGKADRPPGLPVQVAPAFRDAPGVSQDNRRRVRLKPLPSDTWPGFHPPLQSSAQAELPEVTMVFCGPAQYKVT